MCQAGSLCLQSQGRAVAEEPERASSAQRVPNAQSIFHLLGFAAYTDELDKRTNKANQNILI